MVIGFSLEQWRYIYHDKDGNLKIYDFCPDDIRKDIEKIMKKLDKLSKVETIEEYHNFMFD